MTKRQDQPTVYFDPEIDKWVYRASGLGNCLGHLVRCRLGVTPDPAPEFMQNAFDAGKHHEPAILDWLQRPTTIPGGGGGIALLNDYDLSVLQFEVVDEQVEVDIPVGTTCVVRVHPDGIGKVFAVPLGSELELRELVVVEAKALGKDFIAKFRREGVGAIPNYAWQLSVEMVATGLPAVYVKAQKGEKGTEDETGHRPIIGFEPIQVYREPPYSLGQIKARVLKIEALAEREEIPECDYKMFPCGFWQDHDTEKGVWLKKAEGVEIDDYEEATRTIALALDKDDSAHVEELVDLIAGRNKLIVQKAEIEAELKRRNVPIDNLSNWLSRRAKITDGVVNTNGHKIRLQPKTIKGRVSWKSAALSRMTQEEAEAEFKGASRDTIEVTLLERD